SDPAHLTRQEQIAQIASGERAPHARHRLRRSFGDDLATRLPTLGAEIDDVVGGLHDVQVVLDDDDRIPRVDETVEYLEEALDVGEVKAGRRLVEDVQGPAGGTPAQLGRELDALRLTTRERRCSLAEVDVAETDVVQRAELRLRDRNVLEELECFLDGHLENVGDRLALVMDLERLAVVALPAADLAGDVDVG